jgi:hypothetical protein
MELGYFDDMFGKNEERKETKDSNNAKHESVKSGK